MQGWETTFNQLMDALMPQLTEGEAITVGLVAEESEFTRFNHAKVRQTGSIENGSMAVTLMANGRSATESITFTGEKEADWPLLMTALQTLRDELPQLPEDPYIVLPTGDDHSRDVYDGELLTMAAIAPTLLPKMAGLDAVGLYAGGRCVRAYADSAGQRHWFATETFTLDYSLFTESGQAVKGTYAGRTWDDAAYAENLTAAQTLLARISLPPKPLERD